MSETSSRGMTRRDFTQRAATVVAAASTGILGVVPKRAAALPPVWSAIPDQTWTVGQPVYLDLADYCTDAELDALTFALDNALPNGVSLSGSVISGTPTGTFTASQFVATADDGEPPPRPLPPGNLAPA